MIYLSIPQGMIFKKRTTVTIENGITKETTRDCFVDPNARKPDIELQFLVKEALRNNHGRKKCIKLPELTISLRKPPKDTVDFLVYEPNHNGKYPTDTEPKLRLGIKGKKYDPSIYSHYGTFWFQQTYLTKEEKNKLFAKMLEQKANRKHIGSSPLAT